MGLLFAKEVGVRDVLLEGDSMIVYNALYNYSLPHLQLLLWSKVFKTLVVTFEVKVILMLGDKETYLPIF